MWPFTGDYKSVVESKRAERARLISSVPKSLAEPTKRAEILSAKVQTIVKGIEAGEWTATEVLEVYISQAVVAHEATNCATEVLFETALKQAKALDEEFASTKQLRGPLHGVPFSAKDQFEIVGFDTSVGFTQWANKPATVNAALVEQLLGLGAIPIMKTNLPQTMFNFECFNPLWGRSTNPYNDKYTCGGSSGGECALLAMDGAMFGLGSDTGGSLRIPAAYCGIYSLKPTFGRVSYHGALSPTPGFEGTQTVTGPLVRSIEDLELFCKLIFGRSDNDLDCHLLPMPYREPEMPRKLRFGYYTRDGFVKASPANKRAVDEAISALRKAGHECVEIEIPDVTEAFEIFLGLTSSDGYRQMTSHLGPDPMDSSLWLPVYAARLPRFLATIAGWVIKSLLGDSKFAFVMSAAREKPFGEYVNYTEKKNQWIAMFYREVWQKYALDGIIAPVQGLPQMPNGGTTELSPVIIGTTLYNVVESPAGVVPITLVDPTRDQLTEDWTAKKYGSVLLDDLLYKAKKPYYDPESMAGMPVAVQVIGKKWEDEKVIAMMRILDEALGKRSFGPGTLSCKST